MMLSGFNEAQAMDMGITDAAVRQADEAARARNASTCGCEHQDHFGVRREASGAHGYLMVPAGQRHAQFVGKVCDLCAETCMANYLI